MELLIDVIDRIPTKNEKHFIRSTNYQPFSPYSL
jgi:hypothetical protein